jgi:membrane protease YdiL (CAAX protease family)
MSSNPEWPGTSQDIVPPPPVPPVITNESAKPAEDPPFSGWDVTLIAFLMFIAPVLILEPIAVLTVQKIFYRQLTITQVALKPWMVLGPQFFWSIVMVVYLVDFMQRRFHRSLLDAISWNWPKAAWLRLVGISAATLIFLQALERILPLPKKSPFDQFFKQPADAYAFAFLAIAIAPFTEELFFRGLLYPVLARRIGVAMAVLLTALPFALIHAFEYKAWAPVLIVFLVGVVLTLVRAKLHSVGASFVVHSIYNGVPVIAVVIASHGFQHLEKLAQ